MGSADDEGRAHRPGRRERADREFDAFFNAVWARARGVGGRMGLSPEEAEDTALDALAITYDRWERVRRMDHPQAWTLKVAANLALRRLKRQPPLAQPAPALSSVEDRVASRLALGTLMQALPRRQREVVALRYLADLPETEVAVALGIDVGTVKQHASRGRSALKYALTLPQEGVDDAR